MKRAFYTLKGDFHIWAGTYMTLGGERGVVAGLKSNIKSNPLVFSSELSYSDPSLSTKEVQARSHTAACDLAIEDWNAEPTTETGIQIQLDQQTRKHFSPVTFLHETGHNQETSKPGVFLPPPHPQTPRSSALLTPQEVYTLSPSQSTSPQPCLGPNHPNTQLFSLALVPSQHTHTHSHTHSLSHTQSREGWAVTNSCLQKHEVGGGSGVSLPDQRFVAKITFRTVREISSRWKFHCLFKEANGASFSSPESSYRWLKMFCKLPNVAPKDPLKKLKTR